MTAWVLMPGRIVGFSELHMPLEKHKKSPCSLLKSTVQKYKSWPVRLFLSTLMPSLQKNDVQSAVLHVLSLPMTTKQRKLKGGVKKNL